MPHPGTKRVEFAMERLRRGAAISIDPEKPDIEDLLHLMVEVGASDLFLSVGSPPVLRVEGVLHPIPELAVLSPNWIREVFITVADDEAQQTFLRWKELDFAYDVPGLARFRINACLQRGTISLSFRLIPSTIPTIDELGIPQVCKQLVTRTRGLVLLTGPVGSGKSTTLAAMINYLNETESRRVVTVEDPIEFVHQDKKCSIIQREVGRDTFSFSAALRHLLRQNPDVIAIGEMRDLETMATAVTAAETGHLVLATIHTGGAIQAIDRIIDVFPPEQQNQIRVQLSVALEAVVSQILLPRLDGRGRIAAFEVIIAIPAIRNLIRDGKTNQIHSFLQTGRQYGMQTMDQALQTLVERRLISPYEAALRADSGDKLRFDV